jgi:hypothetical protein
MKQEMITAKFDLLMDTMELLRTNGTKVLYILMQTMTQKEISPRGPILIPSTGHGVFWNGMKANIEL